MSVEGGDPIEIVGADPAWGAMGEVAATEVHGALGLFVVEIELAAEHRHDRVAYTDAKSEFIHTIERRCGARP